MSAIDRIRTTAEDERVIDETRRALVGPHVDIMDKWHVLRLALMLSLSLPDEPAAMPEDAKQDGDYRLQQVTGKGKGESDYTDLFRGVLSVRHNVDLFDRVEGDHRFKDLLERHIHRGLVDLKRRRGDDDIYEFLQREFSRLAGSSDLPSNHREPPRPAESIVGGLRDIGVRGEVREIVPGPRLTMYQLHLPVVHHYDLLKHGLEKLAFTLGLARQGLTLRRSTGPKEVELYLPRSQETWTHVHAHDLRSWANAPTTHALPVWLGVDILGKPFQFDLAKTPHLFVAGTTGSGKSVCLHALLCSLLLARSARDAQFCLIDTKKTELSEYRRAPHLWGNKVHTTVEEAQAALEQIIDEMERRRTSFVKLGVRDIAGAKSQSSSPIPYIVVVVEELAELVQQGQQAMEELLTRIAQTGRSSGIHLVLSTQRPDAKTFSGQLRSNIPSRIALAVQKATESKIILDDLGAERLLKPGDMLVRLSGDEPVRVHGVNLSADDVARILQQCKQEQA